MGFPASIVSAVLKAVAADKFGSGLIKDLIGVSIDGISEKGINEITDFINDGKSKIERILSRENMESMDIPDNYIDYVVAEIKELLSKIDITDEVLRQCKYDSMNLSVFLWDKYRECKNDCIDCESEIKRCLFGVAETLIKLVRESDDFERDILIHISNAVDEIQLAEQSNSQNLNAMIENTFKNFPFYNRMYDNDIWELKIEPQKRKETRTLEYAQKWNENMFLNNFNEWDENAGVNVKLNDVYIDAHLPHFIYGNNERVSDDLGDLLSRHIIKNNSKQLLNNKSNKMLLILGQPGIGKSTLITWITAKFNEYIEDILIYKFVEDLKDVNWKKNNISKKILNKLNLSYDELEGKTLILDGFDEVSVEGDRRKVLDNLYGELIYKKNINNFSLIITCRENYIQGFERVKCKYIILQPWNEIQIRSFCNIFQEKTKDEISRSTIEKIIENKEILGIPLILYMVLALNISVEKEGSIVDIYDKIFSLDGGIYDRCIDNKKFADAHRIGEIKEYVHQISRDIAIWMFENKSDEASIPQKEYEKICKNLMEKHEKNEENIKEDFKIGNFFKSVKHCEGVETEEISFIHRSIYEYFVVETIYSSIENAMIELSEENKVELAGNIAFYLKKGKISPTIGENLQYKCIKLYNGLNVDKKQIFYQWWENTIDKMMVNGMFYYTKRNIQDYKNIIEKEERCFLNLLVILRYLLPISNRDYILQNVESDKIIKYIRLGQWGDYSKLFLENADLRGMRLHELELSMVCLRKADLRRTDLIGANLYKADLQGADLRGAELRSIRFKETILKEAKFNENQIAQIENYTCDLREVEIYIEKENRIIDYEEYCRRHGKPDR